MVGWEPYVFTALFGLFFGSFLYLPITSRRSPSDVFFLLLHVKYPVNKFFFRIHERIRAILPEHLRTGDDKYLYSLIQRSNAKVRDKPRNGFPAFRLYCQASRLMKIFCQHITHNSFPSVLSLKQNPVFKEFLTASHEPSFKIILTSCSNYNKFLQYSKKKQHLYDAVFFTVWII